MGYIELERGQMTRLGSLDTTGNQSWFWLLSSQVFGLQLQTNECREKRGWRFVIIGQSRQWSASYSEVTYRNQSQPSKRHHPAFITPLRDLRKALNDQIKYIFIYWFTDSSRIYWALTRCQAPKLMPKGDMDSALGELARLTHIEVRDHSVTRACGCQGGRDEFCWGWTGWSRLCSALQDETREWVVGIPAREGVRGGSGTEVHGWAVWRAL